MIKKYTLVVDFDTVLFRYSLALQKDYIEVQYKNNKKIKIFKNITEFKGRKKSEIEGWLGEQNTKRKKPFLLEDFTISPKSKLILDDRIAHKHLHAYIAELQVLPWVKNLKLVLGGENNFRYEVYPEYKANRGAKPIRFKAVKDWFVNEFKDITTIAEGCEADDYNSIMGWYAWNRDGEKSDICSGTIDKDCNQWPGWHWNYDKRTPEPYFITEFEAAHSLASQLLLGDSTDNIKGCGGVTQEMSEKYSIGVGGLGKSKANKILSNCESVEALFKAVEDCYMMYYQDEWKQALSIQYKLVKLMDKMCEIPEYNFKG